MVYNNKHEKFKNRMCDNWLAKEEGSRKNVSSLKYATVSKSFPQKLGRP